MNRKANRYKYYNYSSAGYYFITICTKDRLPYFGYIEDDEMILNECGEIVTKCWLEIPDHFQKIKTDEFVVMPNHFHGIVIIESNPIPSVGINNSVVVGNRHACSLQPPPPQQVKNENRQHQKLSVIIGSFKSAVSKLIHRNIDKNFQWQKSYYDHIIRNETELNNIREYIRQNPKNWETDRNNPLL